jgi:hypothetical protein
MTVTRRSGPRARSHNEGIRIMSTGTVTPIGRTDLPEHRFELAFLPLHKRAFGTGVGVAAGLFVFVLTVVHAARSEDPYPLILLNQYLYGYSVSMTGAFIGMFWAGVAGFVGGWFFAFCRNFAVAVSVLIVRTRAELKEMRDFLDHI